MISKYLKCLFLILFAGVSAFGADGIVSGTIRTPSALVPISNGNLTFTLNQAAVIAGSAAIAPVAVTCATSTNGSIVGLKNPTVAPTVSVNTASGSLSAGTYYVKVVIYNASGVTLASGVRAAVLSGAGTVTVTAPSAVTGATGYKVYMSATQGSETLQGSVASFVSNYAQSVPLVSGGALPSTNTTTCAMVFNDTMIPTSTKYRVNLTDTNGGQIPGYPQFSYLSGTSVDVSNGWPTARDVETRYFTPIIASPASNATQSVNSPLTLNGYPMTQGAAVFPNNNAPPVCQSGTGYIYEQSGTLTICSDVVSIQGLSISGALDCSSYTGANAGAKITACITALPAGGGTADARALYGAQSWTGCPFTGITKPVTLILGAGTTTLTANCTVPINVTWVMTAGAILSTSNTYTLTHNGPINADQTTHFAGAGTTSITITPVSPRWFGAKGDGANDDTSAITSMIAAGPNHYLSPGTYKVSTVTWPNGVQYNIVFDGATIAGGATSAQSCVVRIKTVNSTFTNMKVTGQYGLNYTTAVWWYDSAAASQYNHINGMQILYSVRGLVYGELPGSSSTGLAQSENAIAGFRTRGVQNPFYSNHSNGVLAVSDSQFISLNEEWSGAAWVAAGSPAFNWTTARVYEDVAGQVNIKGGEWVKAASTLGYMADVGKGTAATMLQVEGVSPIKILANTMNGGGPYFALSKFLMGVDSSSQFEVAAGAVGVLSLDNNEFYRAAGVGAYSGAAFIDATGAAATFESILNRNKFEEWRALNGATDLLVHGGVARYGGNWIHVTAGDPNVYDANNDAVRRNLHPAPGLTPAYAGGNFTTNGAGGWTVEAGDVGEYKYLIEGGYMTLSFTLNTTTITAATGTELRIAIPESRTAVGVTVNPVFIIDGGVRGPGNALTGAGVGYITITRQDGGAWTAGANNAYVYGQTRFALTPL